MVRMRFFVRLVINAVALWLTTLIVSGVHVTPFGDGGIVETVLTFLLVAFVFGLVNGIVGTAHPRRGVPALHPDARADLVRRERAAAAHRRLGSRASSASG